MWTSLDYSNWMKEKLVPSYYIFRFLRSFFPAIELTFFRSLLRLKSNELRIIQAKVRTVKQLVYHRPGVFVFQNQALRRDVALNSSSVQAAHINTTTFNTRNSVFGRGIGWYRCQTSLPTAPWRPEKLIGNIWLSESPSAHPCFSSFHPTLLFSIRPSLRWELLPLALMWWHQLCCKLWTWGVCMCICDILRCMEADRAARPPAAPSEPREMWGDKLASFCRALREDQREMSTQEEGRREIGVWMNIVLLISDGQNMHF